MENGGVESQVSVADEGYEPYLHLLQLAGLQDGLFLCMATEGDEGTCPLCGSKAVASGESVIMDWEGQGEVRLRYASYCICGRGWVEEAMAEMAWTA